MENQIESLNKLKNQEATVRQHIEKLEIDIKMAQATGKTEQIKEHEIELKGLTKLSDELKSQISELNQQVENEKQKIKNQQLLEIEQAEEAERLSREEHAQLSQELYATGQKWMVFGFLMVLGGCFLIIDFSFHFYGPVIAWGIYLIVEGGKKHRQSVYEKYRSQGLTDEDLDEINRKVVEESETRDRNNKELARAIADEMKK